MSMPKQIEPVTPTANSWSTRMVESVILRSSSSQAHWHYEDGLVMKAVAESGDTSGVPRYREFVRDYVDQFITPKGSIRTYRVEEFNLDQINPGKLLFRFLESADGERYRKALALLRDQLKRQPRNSSGGFWHKQIYPRQMWMDGIYMAGPFYAEYASVFHEPSDFDDLAHQIILLEMKTRDPKTGLLYHAWDESRQQRWADPETGCSPCFWGRGMGWFAMGVADALEFFPPGHVHRSALITVLERAAQALIRVQDAATGLWFQVLDRSGDPGNYLETSASAMFAYTFAKSVRRGYLSAEYLAPAVRAFHGLLDQKVKVDHRGLWALEGTCGVAGLGGQPYRDGSYGYYVGEKTVPNDPKGMGAFILAALEMEAAGIEIPDTE
jgi:unsaturated rhamnogalacturonyl hydrolase